MIGIGHTRAQRFQDTHDPLGIDQRLPATLDGDPVVYKPLILLNKHFILIIGIQTLFLKYLKSLG